MGKGESKTSPRRVASALNQASALDLRVQGYTYDQIANALGFADPSGAYKAVVAGLVKTISPKAEELREIEGARLDEAQRAIWPQVLAGDLAAVAVYVRLSERRARLFGLDTMKANVHAHLITGGVRIEYVENGQTRPSPSWAEVIEMPTDDDN